VYREDPQPGPIGRRHSSTGGEVDQSVWICVPGIILSRPGPRKPGPFGFCLRRNGSLRNTSGRASALWAPMGSTEILAATAAAGSAPGRAPGSADAWLPDCATNRCSRVFDQRQAKSAAAHPVMPLVRRSVHPPHASTIAAPWPRAETR